MTIFRSAIRCSTMVILMITMGLAADVSVVGAQVARQPVARTSARLDDSTRQAMETMVDPLRAEVERLGQEVSRLQAALGSLRLTVNANQQEYASHRHGVPIYGITSAKSVCPDTPAIDGTMLPFTTSGGPKKGLSGPPEPAG